jgi:hypothetical protein
MNLHPYCSASMYPDIDAQKNLDGRSHYVDPDTLRYFRSRITHTETAANGTLYVLVESRGIESKEGTRGMRVVVFDIAGNVRDYPGDGTWYASTRAARKAIPGILERIDARAVNLAALQSISIWHDGEMARTRDLIEDRTPAPANT